MCSHTAARRRHAPQHLDLPPVGRRSAGDRHQVIGAARLGQQPCERTAGGEAVGAGGSDHDGAAVDHHPLRRGHPLHGLVEVAVQRIAGVGGQDHVETSRHSLDGRVLDEVARGAMTVGERAGEHRCQLASVVDGDVERQGGRCQGRRRPDEVVDRVSLRDEPGGPRVGDACRAVRIEDGLGGGQAGADTLGASAESGEEMRLDEAGEDADVGIQVARVDEDPGAVHHTHRDVGVVVGPVVVDGVAGDDVVTDEFGHLLGRGLAVGTGGAEQLHAVGTGAESLELGQ